MSHKKKVVIKNHLVKKYYAKNFPWAIEALKRDNFKCVDCGSDEKVIVHHLDESRIKGDKYMNNNLDNLKSLCKICHAVKHGFHLRFINPNQELIFELRSQGKTYSYIGNYLGISRQRVHQIVSKIVPRR